jgi:hypothetical protein
VSRGGDWTVVGNGAPDGRRGRRGDGEFGVWERSQGIFCALG